MSCHSLRAAPDFSPAAIASIIVPFMVPNVAKKMAAPHSLQSRHLTKFLQVSKVSSISSVAIDFQPELCKHRWRGRRSFDLDSARNLAAIF
jgi:hypothetical protein